MQATKIVKITRKNPPQSDRLSQTSAVILVLNMYKEGEPVVVYLDVIWLLNLLIDACLLKLTALMLKREVSRVRLWIGALLASSIIILLFTPLSLYISGPLGKVGFSALIIFVTFGYHKWTAFLQNLAGFYFSAFAIGGGLFAIHYFFQNASFYADNHFLTTMNYGDPISWLMVIPAFPLLWYFSKKRIDQTVIRKWQNSLGARVSIFIGDCTIHARGMIDSGNKLYDPLTRLPVMFLSREACNQQLPDQLFAQNQWSESTDWIDTLDDEWKGRVSLVPYQAVDGNPRLICAIRPDQIIIFHEGKRIECRRALIALTGHKLSSEDDFNCILHPAMLQNGKMVKPAS